MDQVNQTQIEPNNVPYEKLIKHCLELYDQFSKSDYRGRTIKEIEASRRIYEQVPQPTNFPWPNASNLIVPLTTITVDNLEPRLVAALIGRDPICQFSLPISEKKDPMTELLENWWNQELKNVVKIEDFTRRTIHLLLTEGTSYSMPSYFVDSKKKKRYVMDERGDVAINPATSEAVTEEYEDDVFEGGKITILPFASIFTADNIDIEDWDDADKIRYLQLSYADLMNLRDTKGYINIGTWLFKDRLMEGDAKDDTLKTPPERIDDATVSGKELIELIECHVTYPIYQDQEIDDETQQTNFQEEKVLATIALRSRTLVRLELLRDIYYENGSLIKRMRLYPEEGKSYGKSVYQKMRGIQDGTSDLFNMLINASYVAMTPWFFYEDKAGLVGKTEIYPGKGVKVQSVDGVLFPQFSISPERMLPVIDSFLALWERVGSIGDLQTGRPSDIAGKNKTATEIMSVIQEGNVKYNYQSQTFKDEFIKIIETLYDFYYQSMPLQKTSWLRGQEFPIKRIMMKRGYKFTLAGSTEKANKLIERKENEDLYGILMNNPMANPIEALKDLLMSYGRTDLDKYINPTMAQGAAILMQNPEAIQVLQKYVATKQEIATAVGAKPEGGGNEPTAI